VPQRVLAWFVEQGMSELWQFIVVLNIFLFIMGMLMDAFSVLLVALPLLVPLAANFGMHPFYLAAMFLLNLEIAYVTPPVGLNLYIASFRFKRPVVEIYRVVMPFVGLLVMGLMIIIFVPKLSSFTVDEEVQQLRAQALKSNVPPTLAWGLGCVQEDRNNPLPCLPEDIEKWGKDGKKRQPSSGITAPTGGSADLADDDTDLDAAFDDEPGDEKKAAVPETEEDLDAAFDEEDEEPPKPGSSADANEKAADEDAFDD
jgi:hypothetical protein